MPYDSFLFKRPEDEAQYMKAYNAVFASYSLRPEEIEVATSFGRTHINAFGSRDAPDLVLLHGLGASSTMWARNIEGLCKHYRIYTLDTIGDLGKSRCKGRLRTGRDYSEWLKEVLDGLKLEKASIAGVSYGGWISLNLALYVPEKTEKIVLIAPAASFEKLCLQFGLRAIPIALIPLRSIKKRLIARFFSWLTGISDKKSLEDDALWNQSLCGFLLGKRRAVVPPSVFKDDELRSITTPTLLLVGEKEVIYDPKEVLDRARKTMPNITTELIPNGTHAMSHDQKEIINSHLIQFLGH